MSFCVSFYLVGYELFCHQAVSTALSIANAAMMIEITLIIDIIMDVTVHLAIFSGWLPVKNKK